MLENLGCQVEIVGSGRHAVDATRRTAFDLILMNCQMPEMAASSSADPPS
ncbi:unnamed protein product, partial [marine sediment metagenome]